MTSDWVNLTIQREIDRELTRTTISEAHRATLARIDDVNKLRGVTLSTRRTYLARMRRLGEFLKKPFEEATRQDIEAFLNNVAKNSGPANLFQFKALTRKFYTLLADPSGETVPDIVKWIKVRQPRNSRKLPEDLVTPDEMKRLLAAATHPRDRALVALLYESAGRLSEVVGLRVGSVEFDRYGARIAVKGKTGSRRIRLLTSVPDLQLWLSHHPGRDDPGAPLFIDLKQPIEMRPFAHDGTARLLWKLASTCGMKKRIHPHLLRHSRLTELARTLSESELKIFAGWTADSAMAKVYIHLSGDDVDRKILRNAGLLSKEETAASSPLAMKSCPRCGTDNSSTTSYCTKCTLPLDRSELEDLMREEEELRDNLPRLIRLLENPQVRRLLAGPNQQPEKPVRESYAHAQQAAAPLSQGQRSDGPALPQGRPRDTLRARRPRVLLP